jgi:hypothetical protein
MVLIPIRIMPPTHEAVLAHVNVFLYAIKPQNTPEQPQKHALEAVFTTFWEILWLIALLFGTFSGYIHYLIAQFLGFSLKDSQPFERTFGGCL